MLAGAAGPSRGYASNVTRIARDPLSGVSRLLVDATNLLHQMSRSTERVPAAALVGRLRAAIPAEIAIELVFDGPPERGLKGERIASGVSVRYGGRFSADTILITLVEDAAMAGGPAAEGILVVSDDRALRSAVGMRGGRTIGAAWLLARLSRPRLAAPSVGNGRPPLRPAMEQEAAATARWAPGRGATRKVGNAKRRPRAGGG
jgi:hypothetical protein